MRAMIPRKRQSRIGRVSVIGVLGWAVSAGVAVTVGRDAIATACPATGDACAPQARLSAKAAATPDRRSGNGR